MYDFGDTEMMEALRPSLEEAQPIQSQVPLPAGAVCWPVMEQLAWCPLPSRPCLGCVVAAPASAGVSGSRACIAGMWACLGSQKPCTAATCCWCPAGLVCFQTLSRVLGSAAPSCMQGSQQAHTQADPPWTRGGIRLPCAPRPAALPQRPGKCIRHMAWCPHGSLSCSGQDVSIPPHAKANVMQLGQPSCLWDACSA